MKFLLTLLGYNKKFNLDYFKDETICNFQLKEVALWQNHNICAIDDCDVAH